MKRFAGTNEHPMIVRIPVVARVAVVTVEPETIVVVPHVEHIEVAVRIGFI